jgi:hypothetical protein
MRIDMKKELGRVKKNNVSLIEYDPADGTIAGHYFIQCGVVGFFANQKELKDLSDVLSYYLNIENYAQCKVVIEGEDVSIS